MWWLIRIEGLGVAAVGFGLGWVIVRLLRLIGWEVRWAGRGSMEFRRKGDTRPPGSGYGMDVHPGPGPGIGSPNDPGGASGSF